MYADKPQTYRNLPIDLEVRKITGGAGQVHLEFSSSAQFNLPVNVPSLTAGSLFVGSVTNDEIQRLQGLNTNTQQETNSLPALFSMAQA